MMPSRLSVFFDILRQRDVGCLSAASGQMSAPGPAVLASSVFEGVTEANARGNGPLRGLMRRKKHPTRELAICTLGFSELQERGLRLTGQAAPLKLRAQMLRLQFGGLVSA
jgi:hypothetical protein